MTSPPAPTEKPDTTPTVSTADKNPKAWVVQVASLAQRDRADALREKLVKQKYTTFVEAVQTDRGYFYRVRVGPMGKRDEAEAMQKELKKKFKLEGVVLPHP